MARIILTGDESVAGNYLSWARSKLYQLKAGMRSLGRRSGNRVFDFDDARVVVSSVFGHDTIFIEGLGGGLIIVCYVGDTTGDFSSKRFYTIDGEEMGRDEAGHPFTPSGWSLIDDGLYGPSAPLDPVDPWNNTYAWPVLPTDLPGGLRIPSCGSGISAKKQASKSGRYILNGAIEDETFQAITWEVVWPGPGPYDYTYQFVKQVDSLTYAPYAVYGPRPYFSRYLGDKVLTMIVPWSGITSTLFWDAYFSDNFLDVIPMVHRIWQVNEDGTRQFVEIADYGESNAAVIGSAAYKDGNDLKVNVIRSNTHDFFGSKMAEPLRKEIYDLTAATMMPGQVFYRSADPADDNVYFYDENTSSGSSSISDDTRIPYSVDDKNRMTYVRLQKSGDFDSINTGLYCAEDLVEESGWEGVVKTPADEVFGPLLIRNTRYRIIHVYSESGFKAVVYSKTAYVSHSDELIPFKVFVASVGDYCQVKKNQIVSRTTYHLSVNGVIHDLGYSNYRREYRLTVPKTAYSGPAIPAVHSHIVAAPWVDAGYDSDGNFLGEDNACVMRCDTNSAKGMLFIGFDVFPVQYRHDLVYDVHNNLTLTFDTGVIAYPPSSDSSYPAVKDRKWMLFGTTGKKIKDIPPPQKPNSGGHVNRINGLAFMGA